MTHTFRSAIRFPPDEGLRGPDLGVHPHRSSGRVRNRVTVSRERGGQAKCLHPLNAFRYDDYHWVTLLDPTDRAGGRQEDLRIGWNKDES